MRAIWAGVLLGLVWVSVASAATHRVPEDYSTINAAIDVAASGDSILVGPGTWTSQTRSLQVCSNFLTKRSVMFLKPGLTIIGTGGAENTILDGGDGVSPSIVTILMTLADGAPVRLVGFTITGDGDGVSLACSDSRLELVDCSIVGNGSVGLSVGGARVSLLNCEVVANRWHAEAPQRAAVVLDDANFTAVGTRFESNPFGAIRGTNMTLFSVEECEFVDHPDGGAIATGGGFVTIRNSLFLRNRSAASGGSGNPGGAISINPAINATVEFCTFAYDSAEGHGGALSIGTAATATIANNTFYRCSASGVGSALIISGTATVVGNVAVECEDALAAPIGNVVLATSGCNLFWGNAENYAFWPEEATATDIIADPQFCNPALLDFTLQDSSPAAAANSGACGVVGAHAVGCGSVSVTPSSWGRLKALYRDGRGGVQ